MQALGPLGQVAGDVQELADAIVHNSPPTVLSPICEFYAGHDLGGMPGPLRFYTVAFYNRDLADDAQFASATSKPMKYGGARLLALGFLRMRPFGVRKASELQNNSLTVLQASNPRTAALLYLGWPAPHDSNDDMNWSRSALDRGLAELASRYPDSLWIKTRQLELNPDPEARKKLGHRWERTPAAAPKEASDWSELPACQVGPEKDSMIFAPERGNNLSLQVTDLLLRGQYEILDALFAELQKTQDPRLELAYWGCLGTPENRKFCFLGLRGWIEARPQSQVASVATSLQSLLDIDRRRWARPPSAKLTEAVEYAGKGWNGDSRDQVALASLVAAHLAQGQSWEEQLQAVVDSLRRDFVQDHSLETLVDLSPALKELAGRTKLADQLKQQLGSDVAYCRIAGRGPWSQVDPKRFNDSLDLLKPSPNYSPVWATEMLLQLSRWGRRSQAARLVPLCKNQEFLPPSIHPKVHQLVVDWATGKGSDPWAPNRLKVGRSHSRYVETPRFEGDPRHTRKLLADGNSVPAEENMEFGFDVHFERPIAADRHWKVIATHPVILSPNGAHTRCERLWTVTPDDPQSLFVSCALRGTPMEWPGRWDIELKDLDSGKTLAVRSFNIFSNR